MNRLQQDTRLSTLGEGYARERGWEKVYQCDYYAWDIDDGDKCTPADIRQLERLVSHKNEDILNLDYAFHVSLKNNEPYFELHVTYKEDTLILYFEERDNHYVLEPFFTYFLPSDNPQYLNTLMWMYLAVYHCPLSMETMFHFHECFPEWLKEKSVVGYPSQWMIHAESLEETGLHF